MKKITLPFFMIAVTFVGCTKSGMDYPASSAITLVNATTDVASAKGYAADHLIAWKTLPATDVAAQYKGVNLGAFTGDNYVMAVSGTDTTIKLYDNSGKGLNNFAAASVSTLFLCGNASNYDGVFISNETFPNYSDSVIGIRFINLSPNSTPLTITQTVGGTGDVAAGLAYKAKTEIKTFNASATLTGGITFQIKNGTTVLATYNLPVTPASAYNNVGMIHSRFKNVTLVIKGLQGTTLGTNAFGVFPVPHY